MMPVLQIRKLKLREVQGQTPHSPLWPVPMTPPPVPHFPTPYLLSCSHTPSSKGLFYTLLACPWSLSKADSGECLKGPEASEIQEEGGHGWVLEKTQTRR